MLRPTLAVILLTMASGPLDARSEAQEILAVRDVTVIDPSASHIDDARLPDQTVLVRGGRIIEVGPALEIPADAQVVDGNGLFAVPGFLDMHVHFNRDDVSQRQVMGPLMIANGVTGARDMFSDCWEPCAPGRRTLDEMRRLQSQIETGEVMAPRLLALSSPLVHGPRGNSGYPPGEYPSFWQPSTPEEGREVVRFLKARGVDSIKPYNTLPREVYLAMLEEARRLGIPVSGHLPWSVHPAEAAEAGASTIEHARWPVMACNDGYEAFRLMHDRYTGMESEWSDEVFRAFRDSVTIGFDPSSCRVTLSRIAAAGTYLVPTHLTRQMDARASEEDYRNDPRRRYVTPARLRGWDRDLANTAGHPPPLQAMYDSVFAAGLRVTGMAQDEGVKLMVGTDVFDTMVFPGFSYHDELELLSRAGLTPLQILRAATYTAAEYLDRLDDLASVSEGRLADFVLLEADPLVDIRNSRTISAVIFNGQYLGRDRLDQMTESVARLVANQ